MILTTCAACAKPLEHDAPAHCVNCQTRYCSDRCLRYHAHRGGHDDQCVARRVLGESDALNFRMRKIFAITLYEPPDATRGDLLEAVAELEDLEPTARRMLGGAHPLVVAIERNLDESRDALYARGLP